MENSQEAISRFGVILCEIGMDCSLVAIGVACRGSGLTAWLGPRSRVVRRRLCFTSEGGCPQVRSQHGRLSGGGHRVGTATGEGRSGCGTRSGGQRQNRGRTEVTHHSGHSASRGQDQAGRDRRGIRCQPAADPRGSAYPRILRAGHSRRIDRRVGVHARS